MNISKHILESASAALRVNKHWNRIIENTKQFGRLVVHIGDALASSATVEGGFAGLIVDIFSDGAMIPALQLPETLQHLQAPLYPGGRIMVNCGGLCVKAEGRFAKDGELTMEETIAAISEIFPTICHEESSGAQSTTQQSSLFHYPTCKLGSKPYMRA